jgi:hypothetical protein
MAWISQSFNAILTDESALVLWHRWLRLNLIRVHEVLLHRKRSPIVDLLPTGNYRLDLHGLTLFKAFSRKSTGLPPVKLRTPAIRKVRAESRGHCVGE